MALPLAEALSPHAHIEPFDATRDCKALYRLAVWFLKYSPLVGLDYELFSARSTNTLSTVSPLHYGIIVDLTGTERLHRDLREFATFIQKTFSHSARVALAPTVGCAWALSRYGSSATWPMTTPSLHHITQAIAPLPVQALRINEQCAQLLHDVGITVIGELASMPRRSLAQRFGKFLLYRLDQLCGSIEERLHTVTPPRHFASSRIFEPPLIHRGAIVIAIEHIFKELLQQLKQESKLAKYFSLTIRDTALQLSTKEFPLAAATSDQTHIAAIIQPIIDSMSFFGEVREISLKAKQIESATTQQKTFGASSDVQAPEQEQRELMNAFSIRIGKDRVSLARLHHSYIPEHSFSYHSAITERDNKSHNQIAEPLTPYSITERPSLLLERPEQITTIAMLPDKPPSFLQWRGSHLKIIAGIGPERITPEWWQQNIQTGTFSERDYFKVQDDCGRWLWVYREQKTQEWFLHGVWT
jgi:protein ImuB